jgi:hypothetical protein
MAANWRIPAAMVESRRTAVRVTFGATSLSSSSHFAAIAYSKIVNPVALPPGRARLLMKPAPTGSITPANTIGTVRVTCSNAATVALALARITSGASETSSPAYRRKRSASPAPQRMSRRALRPSFQPSAIIFCANAARRARPCALAHIHQHANAPDPLTRLAARGPWPCCRHAAEEQ